MLSRQCNLAFCCHWFAAAMCMVLLLCCSLFLTLLDLPPAAAGHHHRTAVFGDHWAAGQCAGSHRRRLPALPILQGKLPAD